MGIRKNIWLYIFFFMVGVLSLPVISSCNKNGNINPTEAKIEYQVLNLSYDALPLNLYVKFLKQNPSLLRYPTPSGYFGLNTIDTPFQIRSAQTGSVINLLDIDSTNLRRETRYSLFVIGSRKDNTLNYIFTTDASTPPTPGFCKVRFLNGALPVKGADKGLDLTANDTVAFGAIKYDSVTRFLQIPAGIYSFKVRPTKSNTEVLDELANTRLEDGRLYTIYTYGLAFKTDTTAFGASILTNR